VGAGGDEERKVGGGGSEKEGRKKNWVEDIYSHQLTDQ